MDIEETDYLRNLWRGTPVYAYFNAKVMFTGVKTDDRLVGSMEILRDTTGRYDANWRSVWTSIHKPVNGQVKNFLVAVRTVAQAPKGVPFSILVRGSKMQEMSGLWHRHFLDWLEMRNPKSSVVFADPSEIPRQTSKTVKVLYVVGNVHETESQILIDDAQIGDVVPPIKGNFSYYSRKKEGTPFVNQELRLFSHSIEVQPPECPCHVCKVITMAAEDFEQAQYLQDSVVQLGHVRCVQHPKSRYVDSDHKRIVAKVLQASKEGRYVIETTQDERVQERVLNVIGKQLEDDRVMDYTSLDEKKLVQGWSSQFGYRFIGSGCAHRSCKCDLELYTADKVFRIKGTVANKEDRINEIIRQQGRTLLDECHVVKGKRVIFIGVASDFFFPTKLNVSTGDPDVVVLARGCALPVPAAYVFSLDKVVGYDKTSYVWRGYTMYIKRAPPRYELAVKGLPLIRTRFKTRWRRLVTKVLIGERFFIHRTENGWEMQDSDNGAVFSMVISGEEGYAMPSKELFTTSQLRAGFIQEWVTGSEVQDERMVPHRWALLLELKTYALSGLIRGLYYKVMTQLPPEVIDLIDRYLLPY